MAENKKKKYRFEARIIQDDIIGYEDIATNEIDRCYKYIIFIADGNMVVAVVRMLSTI